MGKKSLGRGLSALYNDHHILDSHQSQNSKEHFEEVSMDLIEVNPFQPRRHFSVEEINELAATISQQGLLQPISIRKHNQKYQIIAGERRFRAFQSLGKTQIPARVFERLTDKQMMELALIENIQRVQLSPVEEALAYQKLIEHHDYRHEDLGNILGKSRSAVTNTLRLLKLPEQVQTWIQEGKLSAGHARNLLRPDVDDIIKTAELMMNESMSVRDAEKKIPSSQDKKKILQKNPNIIAIEEELKYALTTQVRLIEKRSEGRIEIDFSSLEELNRIRQILQLGAQAQESYGH
jgi:ParB family transcriptional regulator, chromosome partitioning protein